MKLTRTVLGFVVIVYGLAIGAYAALPCIEGCQCNSPIVIDIDGKGIQLTDAINGVMFDISGNGTPIRLAWTAPGVRNAWLALDRNGNGMIDNGKELFGNVTPQPDCATPNGFLALAEFDTIENGGNKDGVISSSDSVYWSLRLWIDSNHNGVSEPGELFQIPSLNISSISLDYKLSAKKDRYGNEFRYRSKVNIEPGRPDGVGPNAYDVFLSMQRPTPTETRLEPNGTINGADHPDQIPTDVVHSIFLNIASCSASDPELHQKKCRLVQRSIGLDPDDMKQLPVNLDGFRDEIKELDDSIADLGRSSAPNRDETKIALIHKRQTLITGKIASLKQKLTPEGRRRFDGYIENMKTKIKFVPNVTPRT